MRAVAAAGRFADRRPESLSPQEWIDIAATWEGS